MNFSVFLLSTFVTAGPVPFDMRNHPAGDGQSGFRPGRPRIHHRNQLPALCQGAKKGIATAATLLGNSSALFILLWAWLLYGEDVNASMVLGALIMAGGLVLINLPLPSGTLVRDKIAK